MKSFSLFDFESFSFEAVFGSMIFLTSSVKLFTKCESFPRFTTNVFGTFVDDLTFFFAPFVFSSLTACVRFFFLRVFAISITNMHALFLSLSLDRTEKKRHRDKEEEFQSVFVNTNEGGGVFFEVRFFERKRLSEKEKKNESDESRAATEKYSRDELASSFTPSSRESHEKKKKKKKKRTIIVFPRSPLRARY